VQRKIPYLVIVGRREAAENTLTVRGRDEGEMRGIILEEFMEMMKKRIEARR
jgi:threonyl-tRNA synthetase